MKKTVLKEIKFLFTLYINVVKNLQIIKENNSIVMQAKNFKVTEMWLKLKLKLIFTLEI